VVSHLSLAFHCFHYSRFCVFWLCRFVRASLPRLGNLPRDLRVPVVSCSRLGFYSAVQLCCYSAARLDCGWAAVCSLVD
jgi:hypothetical protein